MKAVTVIGTRPEIIKMAPLIPLLDKHFEHHFVFTSQHYSENMVEIFLNEMDVRRPDSFLHVDSSELDLLEQAIGAELAKLQPDLLLIYGDTNSTLAAARSIPEKTKVVHIEAGIRSFDKRMPEELNRIETDRISHFKLAPTGLAKYFLTDLEGYKEDGIAVVGNLVVDAYRIHEEKIAATALPFDLKENGYYLLTMHRKENVDLADRLKGILESLAKLSKPVIFPVHPRTRKRMVEFGMEFPDNLRCIDPIGYFQFMRLMRSCDVVITDSGGIQEEAITLGIPCVTLRDNSERMETVFLKANILYDADHRRDLEKVVEEMSKNRPEIQKLTNPYGDGHSAEKIVDYLLRELG